MLSLSDAARETLISPSEIIKAAYKHEIKLFFKVKKDIKIHCLGSPTKTTSLSSSGSQKEAFFSYAVISCHDYCELLAGPIEINEFREAAYIDYDTGEIQIEYASSFAKANDIYRKQLNMINPLQSLNAIFAVYEAKPRTLISSKPSLAENAERRSLHITRENLHISKASLLEIIDDAQIIIPHEPHLIHPWMNKRLEMLNRICEQLKKMGCTSESAEDKKALKNKAETLIKQEYLRLEGNPMGEDRLAACVRMLVERETPSNIAPPTPDAAARYPSYLPPFLINMNEVARSFYEEIKDKTDKERKLPKMEIAKDRAIEVKALPSRESLLLQSFLLPAL